MALAENTGAAVAVRELEDNNDMFRAVLGKVDGMARDFAAEVVARHGRVQGHLHPSVTR